MVINIIIPFLIRIFLKNQTRMFSLLINAATFKSKAMDTRNFTRHNIPFTSNSIPNSNIQNSNIQDRNIHNSNMKTVTYILITVINSSVTYKTITVANSILYTSYILTLYHFFMILVHMNSVSSHKWIYFLFTSLY